MTDYLHYSDAQHSLDDIGNSVCYGAMDGDTKAQLYTANPDLSPKNKTMTLLRFPLNLLIRRSHYEKALHRRTNH